MTVDTGMAETDDVVTPRRGKRSIARDFAPIAVAAALMALVPLRYHDSRSMMVVIIIGMLFVAYTTAFNVIFGSTGQLFLCTGALAGIGGFGSAILSDRVGIPMLISIVVAGLIAGLVGALLSWIAVSRSLDTIFTGIVTLAFSLSFQNLVLGRRDLTGGENGLRIAAGSDTILRDQVKPYYVFLALVVVYLVLYRVIQRSHIGWAFRALRDDEVAAELSGVDVTRYRVYAGLIGSMMLGVAGAMFAHHRGFIGTSTYAFGNVDVRVLVMLAFGGMIIDGAVIVRGSRVIIDGMIFRLTRLRGLFGVSLISMTLGHGNAAARQEQERNEKHPTRRRQHPYLACG